MTDTKLRNLSDFLLGIFFASAQDAELDAAIGPIGATSQSGAQDRPSSDDGSVASPDDPVLASQSAAAPNLTVSATGTPLQLAAYSYTPASEAGSNVPTAWRYSTGQNTTVAVIDDGFDPTITGLFANFNSALSVNFGQGGPGDLAEPTSSFHGTSTAAEIGDSGTGVQPTGVAPNATIIGVKVDFTSAPIGQMAVALNYAASVAEVVNDSWSYAGFGAGEPTDPDFAAWYEAVQTAVQTDRGGLGSILVFAAGNYRAENADLALEPITADPREIAVAATDSDGSVATYSDPGAALLVAATGDDITAPAPGGTSTTLVDGTSFAAPLVSGIVSLMLSANPDLGWRDVQEILADSAYDPPQSGAVFTTNGATDWNGGGMQFSNDLGFGVVDANVAVNLALAWTEQLTDTNLITTTVEHVGLFSVGDDADTTSYLSFTEALRIQHVQVGFTDTTLPAGATRLVLVSPDGTHSVLMDDPGQVGTTDNTNGLDLDGTVITSNAFWGEDSAGVWSLQIQDSNGAVLGEIADWTLTVWGDNVSTATPPLVYTPEFANLVAADPARATVSPGANTTTIDFIALPGNTVVNLNGGPAELDGIPVTVRPGLRNANADGCTADVVLTGLTTGGSELTGGNGLTALNGAGHDTINSGLGTTTIKTAAGGSTVTLSDTASSQVSITSGGNDVIYAGLATATISDVGSKGDTIYSDDATLSFIGGSGSTTVHTGAGSVLIQSGNGGGTFSVASSAAAHDTITVGGVADMITIQAGHSGGLDVIKGFRLGIDQLVLAGYASGVATAALQAQSSDGAGGTLLHLPDGMTLDFVGIGHLTTSVFS